MKRMGSKQKNKKTTTIRAPEENAKGTPESVCLRVTAESTGLQAWPREGCVNTPTETR